MSIPTDDGEITVAVTDVPVEVCDACGEEFSGIEAARKRHQAICQTLGLLTPEAIKDIRERIFSMSQSEFAQLTGIGEATISRWERGRLIQSKAHDGYLRMLARHPDDAGSGNGNKVDSARGDVIVDVKQGAVGGTEGNQPALRCLIEILGADWKELRSFGFTDLVKATLEFGLSANQEQLQTMTRLLKNRGEKAVELLTEFRRLSEILSAK